MNLDNIKHLIIDGKSAVRLAVGDDVLWKGLPNGYKKLDYIETTGTQWIDTGFVPNQDSRFVGEFAFISGDGIWGTRTATTSNNFNMRVISGNYQAGYGATLLGTSVGNDENWHKVDQNKNICYLDGVARAEFTYETFKSPKSIALGGINANNRFYYGSCRYRCCQIYDNGVLVRDLIPCKNVDGEIGMYDTLNAIFYGNAGSGELIAGAEL